MTLELFGYGLGIFLICLGFGILIDILIEIW